MSSFQNDPNNHNNKDGGGDDDHNNRSSHPKEGENHEDEEVSADCSQYNQNITVDLLNGILARNGASDNIFSSPHPVASSPEDQRRLLTSILQDAVRICSDDDFLPSGNDASAYSRRASSSSNPEPNKRSDLHQ